VVAQAVSNSRHEMPNQRINVLLQRPFGVAETAGGGKPDRL